MTRTHVTSLGPRQGRSFALSWAEQIPAGLYSRGVVQCPRLGEDVVWRESSTNGRRWFVGWNGCFPRTASIRRARARRPPGYWPWFPKGRIGFFSRPYHVTPVG